jgi:hypothetical protein
MDWKNLNAESVGKTLTQIEKTLESTKEIKSHALSANYIFQPMVYSGKDYYYEGKNLNCFHGEGGPGFCEVLDIELIAKSWI